MKHTKKKKKRARKKRAKKQAKKHAAILRAPESGAPRPRCKLPEAMRLAGLDEHSVAQCLAEQIKQLQAKNPSRMPRKLLLDYLKECVRILYAPARRGDVPEQPTTVELVHFVPRPERDEPKPPVTPGTGN